MEKQGNPACGESQIRNHNMQTYAEITKSHVWPNRVIICFPETPVIFPSPPGVSKEKWGHVEWEDVAAENTSLLAGKSLPRAVLLVT